jgi:hypothetical protein
VDEDDDDEEEKEEGLPLDRLLQASLAPLLSV